MHKILGSFATLLLLSACSDPPKPQIPGLTPEGANEILNHNSKAAGWLEHVRKQNPSCAYELDIPDQASQPIQLDFSHIVKCGGRVSPIEFDASVSFTYDKDTQHWMISRFSD